MHENFGFDGITESNFQKGTKKGTEKGTEIGTKQGTEKGTEKIMLLNPVPGRRHFGRRRRRQRPPRRPLLGELKEREREKTKIL